MGAKAWYLPCLKAEQNYELKDLWICPSEYGLCLNCKPGGKLEQSRLILWCGAPLYVLLDMRANGNV